MRYKIYLDKTFFKTWY